LDLYNLHKARLQILSRFVFKDIGIVNPVWIDQVVKNRYERENQSRRGQKAKRPFFKFHTTFLKVKI
jgi:hypothetical protein